MRKPEKRADKRFVVFLKAGGDRISGKLGGRVYRDVGGGDIVVAAAPAPISNSAPGQVASQAQMRRVLAAWAELPLETIARWRA